MTDKELLDCLTDRPCAVCRFHEEKGCTEWECVFDEREQVTKTDYKSFAEWVASEIFTEDWEFNKDSFAEIACRKLSKLGIVTSEGDVWRLKESEVEE